MKIATADSVHPFARLLTTGCSWRRRMHPHRGVEASVAQPALNESSMALAASHAESAGQLAPSPSSTWSAEEQRAIEEVLLHARSASTRRAYHSDWRAFASWCEQRQVTSLPIDLAQLSLYLRSMHDNGKRIATIERALVAISVAHERSGHPSPRQTAAIREMMRGLRRMKSDVPVQHAPALTLAHLQKLIDASADNTSMDLRNRALLLIGFFGAMRRSEIVGLRRSDIKETEEGLVIKIRRSKTDQEGRGHVIGIRRQRNAAYCPVLTYAAWLAAHPGGEFAFVALGPGRIGEPVTPQTVRLVLESMAKRARISVDYSPHSLRAGFATAAAKAGIADRAIMRQTRHKSVQMLSRYVQEGSAFIAGVDALL